MKTLRFMTALLVCALLIATLTCSAWAENGSVSYQGRADGIIFSPGTEESPTNLFPELRELMPGDSASQTIIVKNDMTGRTKLRVYLRSLGADEESTALLSQLQLRVEQVNKGELYSGEAHLTGDLAQWQLLCTVYPGASVELLVTVDVPIELGNEFAGLAGRLDWEFMVEEIPMSNGDVSTGDASNPTAYIAGAFMCLSAALLLAYELRRRSRA